MNSESLVHIYRESIFGMFSEPLEPLNLIQRLKVEEKRKLNYAVFMSVCHALGLARRAPFDFSYAHFVLAIRELVSSHFVGAECLIFVGESGSHQKRTIVLMRLV